MQVWSKIAQLSCMDSVLHLKLCPHVHACILMSYFYIPVHNFSTPPPPHHRSHAFAETIKCNREHASYSISWRHNFLRIYSRYVNWKRLYLLSPRHNFRATNFPVTPEHEIFSCAEYVHTEHVTDDIHSQVQMGENKLYGSRA